MATREIRGMISLSNCSCLPLSSGRSRNTPVILPPGFARLRTNPIATGSLSRSTATIGMWLVACLAAASAAAPRTKRTSTLSRTRSAASWDSRSGLPSACRYSTTTFRPSVYPNSPSPCLNASLSNGSMAVTPSIAIRGVLARGCALYSCAWAAAPIGANPMATPVRKRRREITGRPAPRRRGPTTGTMTEKRREAAQHEGQELADQRTLLRRAPGGLRRDCPGRQENGATGSRESGPLEGRYKANLAVPAPQLGVHGPEGGGRVRYYVGVDWADQTHAVWVVDESGTKITGRTVPHTAEGLSEWGRELDEWRAQGIERWAAIERPDGRVVDFRLDHGVVVYPVNPKALDRARDRFRQSG